MGIEVRHPDRRVEAWQGEEETGEAGRDVLVCFSHLRWGFVYQRPQHLLTRAAASHDVIFVEEPAFEDIAAPYLHVVKPPEGVTVVIPILPHGLGEPEAVDAQRHLVDALLAGLAGRTRVFWYYTPMALEFTRHHEADLVVYDNMDELSLFAGASARMVQLETEMLRRADLVFTGGQSLYEAKKHRHANIHAFPSSIDPEHFRQARSWPKGDPADQATIPRPRLGFFGVIDERMDLGLVSEVADLRPDWHLVMIGPVMKIDPADLPRRPNIHWLGSKEYRDLPGYLAGWDLGFMPFALNESTLFISPTKTPEFLAAGLPVISTPIRDVVRSYGEAGLVDIASDAREIVTVAQQRLAGPSPAWRAAVDGCLAAQSWDLTWEGMSARMREQLTAARVRNVLTQAEQAVADAARV